MAHIVFEDVTFRWPGGKGFDQANFSLEQGDFAVLSGPSGEGKSTLLRLLVRFEEPRQGRILYKGKPLAEYAPSRLRRSMALVQQTPVMGAMHVRDALLLPFTFAANADLPRPAEMRLLEQLKAVRLADVGLDTPAADLSLGQKQRVALARTLLLEPDTLLLDEPTSSLDAESRHAVEALVEAVHAQGTTVFMITHTDYRPRCPVRELALQNGRLTEGAPTCQAPI